jgi:hypothetical protein
MASIIQNRLISGAERTLSDSRRSLVGPEPKSTVSANNRRWVESRET